MSSVVRIDVVKDEKKEEPESGVDYNEIKELVNLCPQLPHLARKVGLSKPLLSLILKAEKELAEKEAAKA